jgi:membrane fusion protein, multidrug efflux system
MMTDIVRKSGALATVVVLAVGCATAAGDSEEAQSATQDTLRADSVATRIINVEVETVQPTAFTDYIRITGEAEAYNDITVSAEEGGVVTEFVVEKGERVEEGQVFARLDARSLTAQVAEARASADLAREQYERHRKLWEEDHMGTEMAFLQAKYQSEIAAARLATLEVRLAKTEIRSPVSGLLDDRFVEPGEVAMPGTQMARIVATARIKISGGVPERYAATVRRGDAARITFDILPTREFTGTISYVGATVEERSRTFPIEVVIQNPDRMVKPKMVANVQLVRSALKDVLVVSQDVIRRFEDGYLVFVISQRDGTLLASARRVRLGATYANRVVIEDGLSAGDRLITLGAQLVDDGSRVRIVNQTAERVGSED